MYPNTGNDGLHLQLGGVDVASLRVAGAMPGVVVLNAAARNGPGTGLLTVFNGDLTWQAPGSSTPGLAQNILGTAGAVYIVADGADLTQWIEVAAYPDYLPASAQAQVFLQDQYTALGTTGMGDVAAADALAGLVTVTQYTLKNVTNNTILAAALWLDNSAGGFAELSISSDGTNFYQPTSSADPHVLAWASIAAGASVTVWVKRTIAAASASNPSILNLLQWSWTAIA